MIVDLTHLIKNNMPTFPGDASPRLTQIAKVSKDGFCNFLLTTSMHIGTHIDAPAHMLKNGKMICEFPINKFFGRCIVLDARGKKTANAQLLSRAHIKPGDVVLINFGWSKYFGQKKYYYNFPTIGQDLAKLLVSKKISMLGIDTPSPDNAPYKLHKILFKKNILIIENLTNLEKLVNKKNLTLIALPFHFQTDSAPCRVVIKNF